jgi:DNA-directed RNA polymerase subunit beta'
MIFSLIQLDFKGIPSRMGLLLDMSPRSLEEVIYFASYVVVDPGPTGYDPFFHDEL